jgi:hypothetical protein
MVRFWKSRDIFSTMGPVLGIKTKGRMLEKNKAGHCLANNKAELVHLYFTGLGKQSARNAGAWLAGTLESVDIEGVLDVWIEAKQSHQKAVHYGRFVLFWEPNPYAFWQSYLRMHKRK